MKTEENQKTVSDVLSQKKSSVLSGVRTNMEEFRLLLNNFGLKESETDLNMLIDISRSTIVLLSCYGMIRELEETLK